MQKLKLILGVIWALPVTILPFLFYIIPLWVLRKYKYAGWDESTFVWTVDPESLGSSWIDQKIKDAWARWAGSTLGTIVVMKIRVKPDDWYERTLVHEKEHVRQIMILGIFQPIIYSINYLVGRFVLRNTNGYYDNLFEIDARRRAGQLVDVVGAIQKLKASKEP